MARYKSDSDEFYYANMNSCNWSFPLECQFSWTVHWSYTTKTIPNWHRENNIKSILGILWSCRVGIYTWNGTTQFLSFLTSKRMNLDEFFCLIIFFWSTEEITNTLSLMVLDSNPETTSSSTNQTLILHHLHAVMYSETL